jgi:hypothetical protein
MDQRAIVANISSNCSLIRFFLTMFHLTPLIFHLTPLIMNPVQCVVLVCSQLGCLRYT